MTSLWSGHVGPCRPCYVGGCFGGPKKIADDVYTVVQQKCNTARDMNDMWGSP